MMGGDNASGYDLDDERESDKVIGTRRVNREIGSLFVFETPSLSADHGNDKWCGTHSAYPYGDDVRAATLIASLVPSSVSPSGDLR